MNRELPHSAEVGQPILGTMMIYPSVTGIVHDQGPDVQGFYPDIRQCIFFAMMDIANSGKPVDAVALTTRLQSIEQLDLAGDANHIIKLNDTAISSANGVYYIEMIKSRAHLRRSIEAAGQIAEDGFDTVNNLDEIMDKAEQDVLGVMRGCHATDSKSSREVVSSVMQELIRLRSNDNRVTGIRTGYTDLDRMANGLQRGDLTILAAHPAMGETVFALNLALNASFYSPGAIAILSLEMPAGTLTKRTLSAKSAVESNELGSGVTLDDGLSKLSEATNELTASRLFVDNSSNIRISEASSKCHRLKNEYGPDLIVIGYLQLVSGNGKDGGNRQQEISKISRPLRRLAREIGCPVITLSQLSYSVETHPGKHSMLSDLRGSRVIEQDVDIIMFLHRDVYYVKDGEAERNNPADQTDLDVAKHHNGAIGKMELAFQRFISILFNIAHDGFSWCQIVII